MSPEATTQIGSVVTLNGVAWAVTVEGDRVLQSGDSVYTGESIVTARNANIEIEFLDGTLLGQGQEARVDLDEYVFDGESGGLDFQMVKGVMRMVSGKIAEINPDAFNISTPLATIGIRGTEIIAKIDVNGQVVGVTDMSPGHYVIIATPDGEVRIEAPGLFAGVDADGFLTQVQELSQDFVDAVQAAVPLTTLGDAPRDPDDPQPDVPEPTPDGAQGGPSGEPESTGEPVTGPDDTPTPLEGEPFAPPPVLPLVPTDVSGVLPVDLVPPVVPPGDLPEPPEDIPDDIIPVIDANAGEIWVDQVGNATEHTGTPLYDTLSGLDMDDTLYGHGGNDLLDGGSGDDELFGDCDNDTLHGGLGYDSLSGGGGNDSISGGEGGDVLVGGVGNDTLHGGTEGDTFQFTATTDAGDAILDFYAGSCSGDKIALNRSGGNDFGDLRFDGNELSSYAFKSVSHAEYDGTGVDFDSGETKGIVYASEQGSTEGKLYYDPNDAVVGDEILLASITEVDGSGEEADNNLDSNDIMGDVIR